MGVGSSQEATPPQAADTGSEEQPRRRVSRAARLKPGDGSDELHRLIARVEDLEVAHSVARTKALSTEGVILGDDKERQVVSFSKGSTDTLSASTGKWSSESRRLGTSIGPEDSSTTRVRERRRGTILKALNLSVRNQPGRVPKGIHYWAFMVRTRRGAGWCDFSYAFIATVVTIMVQLLTLAIVVESGTSQTCDYKTQTGCRAGEYCSVNYAKGQCNDCATVLPSESTCCPTMQTVCPVIPMENRSKVFYVYDGGTGSQGCHSTNWQLDEYGQGGCIGACAMYDRCIAHDRYPKRCDFLVDAAERLKATHAMLRA